MAPPVSPELQTILSGAHKGINTYPTSLTQGIVPRGIHSHNDYWRDVPFWTALAAGCISIEADVWLDEDELYVGHEPQALTTERTFTALYVKPLLEVLHKQNPQTRFSKDSRNGVFDTSSSQTLYLFVDFKTEPAATFHAVHKDLDILRAGGWLTTVRQNPDGTSTLHPGPVTVVGTGNTPLDLVQKLPRDIFYDAPLPLLGSSASDLTADVSPIASTNFKLQFPNFIGTSFSEQGMSLLKEQVATAHSKGIKVRYWNNPEWPISTRDAVWRTMVTEGVDLVNADDVEAAAGYGTFTW